MITLYSADQPMPLQVVGELPDGRGGHLQSLRELANPGATADLIQQVDMRRANLGVATRTKLVEHRSRHGALDSAHEGDQGRPAGRG